MTPEEIQIKRGVINELRSILKRLDSEAVDSELAPPEAMAQESVELIVPEADQKDPGAMSDPSALDPAALAKLEDEEPIE